MEEFDLIKEVWTEGHQTTPSLESIEKTAKSHKKESMNLIQNVINKTKIEWIVTWIIIVAISIPVGVYTGRWGVIALFVFPVVPYFIDYLNRLRKIKEFDTLNTLEYLKNVHSYIMKSYKQQLRFIIYYFTPVTLIVSYTLGLSIGMEEGGSNISELLMLNERTLKVVVLSIIFLTVAFFLFQKFFPKFTDFWVDKIYGKELEGIKQMIKDLEE